MKNTRLKLLVVVLLLLCVPVLVALPSAASRVLAYTTSWSFDAGAEDWSTWSCARWDAGGYMQLYSGCEFGAASSYTYGWGTGPTLGAGATLSAVVTDTVSVNVAYAFGCGTFNTLGQITVLSPTLALDASGCTIDNINFSVAAGAAVDFDDVVLDAGDIPPTSTPTETPTATATPAATSTPDVTATATPTTTPSSKIYMPFVGGGWLEFDMSFGPGDVFMAFLALLVICHKSVVSAYNSVFKIGKA